MALIGLPLKHLAVNTPLHLLEDCGGVAIQLKREDLNPTGSVKDRVAPAFVDDLVKRGKLHPGMRIVLDSGGNTALSVAHYAIPQGYCVTACVLDVYSQAAKDRLRDLGVEVFEVPHLLPEWDPEGRKGKAYELSQEAGSCYLDQYNNPAGFRTVRDILGPEIWRQTQDDLTHLVAGYGTGASLLGAASYLKRRDPKIRIVAVQPRGSVLDLFVAFETVRNQPLEAQVAALQPIIGMYQALGMQVDMTVNPDAPPNERIEVELDITRMWHIDGIGITLLTKLSQRYLPLIDEVLTVEDETAFEETRRLHAQNILVGGSSGAAVVGAKIVAERLKREHVRGCIVVITPDEWTRSREKVYISYDKS